MRKGFRRRDIFSVDDRERFLQEALYDLLKREAAAEDGEDLARHDLEDVKKLFGGEEDL